MTIIKKKEQNKNETNHKQFSQNRPCGWSQVINKTVSGRTVFKSDGSTIVITPTTWGKLTNLVQWTKTWNSVTKCLCVISRNNNHHQHNHSHNHGGGQHERDIEGSVWKEDVGGCRGVEVRNKEKKREKAKKKLLKEKKKMHFLKTIFNHSLICQFQLIIISITFQSILIQSLSLSLIVDENTNTHSTHQYLSYKSSSIHLLNNNHPCPLILIS